MGGHRRYKVTDDRFGRLALMLREKAGLTQAQVAAAVQVSERSIQQWEAGVAYPAVDNLKRLIALYLEREVFAPGHERASAYALWEQVAQSASRHRALFDEAWFDALLARQADARSASATLSPTQAYAEIAPPAQRADWGEAPDAALVYGREHELDTLAQWALADRCRVVAILGMGGIGKTTLAVRFAQAVAPRFASAVWRSLRNAPPLEELLADCLHTLAGRPSPAVPHSFETHIGLLIDLLRQQRCLLILDNVDTLLQAGSLEGRYRAGYEGYRVLFQRLAETAHQSCVLLTSREMLSEIEPLTGTHASVRALRLNGLARAASQELLNDKDLFGTPEAWKLFAQHYAGNPLALKIAAVTVHDLFGGDIGAFLREGPITLHTLVQLLDDQFGRLSAGERDVIIWLAIGRDMVALEDLSANFAGVMTKKDGLAALKSLRRRSLVERDERGAAFTLQPVVLEYISDWLVAQVSDEIVHGRFDLIARYALMKGHSKDYIRESQIRMLVQPVLDNLLAHFGDRQRLTAHLRLLARHLQAMPDAAQGYAAGNLVNLLVCFQGHIRGWDFSGLALRQAYLQEAEAQDANLADADVGETLFMEPLETIVAMTLSPDGQYLAVGSFSGQVRVWRVADSKLLWTSKGHTRTAWALAFSPDATMLASGGYGGRVKLWDVATGRRLRTLQGHHTWVRTVAFHPDGSILASAGDDATLRVWDIRDGTCRHMLSGHVGLIWSAAFSPDGELLLSAGSDGTLRIWNARTGMCLRILRHPHGVFTVACHRDGTLLASGGEDGQIKLWNMHSGDSLATLQRHAGGSASIAFNPEGTLLASGSNESVVELWEIGDDRTAHYVGILRGHHWLVSAVSFAPQGLLASVGYGGQVKLWDARSGKLLKTIQGYSRLVSALAFSPDGSMLAQGDDNGMVRVWDLGSGHCLTAWQGHVGPVWTIAWRPDGMSFASGGDDCEVKLWEARSGRYLKGFGGHPVVIWALAFSPDGMLLASGGGDKLIKLWRVAGKSEEDQFKVLEGSTGQVMSLTFSADARLLASGNLNGEIKLWDTSTEFTLPLDPSTSLRGTMLGNRGAEGLSAGVASGQCLLTVQHNASPVGALHLSAGGTTLISSANHDVLKWWDAASGECLRTLPADAPGNWVKAAAFSADGAFLATGNAGQTVRLWSIEQEGAARQPTSLFEHSGQVWAVALSADHRTLASSDDEGTVMVWDTQSGALLRRLATDRPYERMNIQGIKGINEAQRAALKALGAVEEA